MFWPWHITGQPLFLELRMCFFAINLKVNWPKHTVVLVEYLRVTNHDHWMWYLKRKEQCSPIFTFNFFLLLFFRISIAKSRENMRWMISWCSPCAAFMVYPPTWLGHNLRNPCRGVGSLVVVWFQSDISQTFCNKCSRKGHLTVCAGFGRGPNTGWIV